MCLSLIICIFNEVIEVLPTLKHIRFCKAPPVSFKNNRENYVIQIQIQQTFIEMLLYANHYAKCLIMMLYHVLSHDISFDLYSNIGKKILLATSFHRWATETHGD